MRCRNERGGPEGPPLYHVTRFRRALVAAVAALLPALAPLLERLTPLSDGHRSIAIHVLTIEAGQRPLLELLAGDEALLAEQSAGAHGVGAVSIAHEAPAAALAALGPALAAPLAKLSSRLLELGPGQIAVAIEIEPVEGTLGASRPALSPSLPSLLGGQPAIIVEIEAIEPLERALDQLLAVEIGATLASRALGGLGKSQAGNGEKAKAREDGKLLHDELRSRLEPDTAPDPTLLSPDFVSRGMNLSQPVAIRS